jgi:hypothetical protein
MASQLAATQGRQQRAVALVTADVATRRRSAGDPGVARNGAQVRPSVVEMDPAAP